MNEKWSGCPIADGSDPAILLDYIERKLDEDTLSGLDRHVNSCPDCHAIVDAQWQVAAALDSWRMESEPAMLAFDERAFDERLMVRLNLEASRPSRWDAFLSALRRPWRAVPVRALVPVGLAATIVLAAALWQQGGFSLQPTPEPAVAESAAEPVDSGVDIEAVERTLSDLQVLEELGMLGAHDSASSGKL